MSERQAPTDQLKRLLAQSVRALGASQAVTIAFGRSRQDTGPGTLNLPEPRQPLDHAELARLRGHADRLALHLAHHDAELHEVGRPSEPRARALYDALEELRCQALGARALPGVARNLMAALADDLTRTQTNRTTGGQEDTERIEALVLLIRERLTGAAPPTAVAAPLERWRNELLEYAGANIARMPAVLTDQEAFARLSHALLRDLRFACDTVAPAGSPGGTAQPRVSEPRAIATEQCSAPMTIAPDDPRRSRDETVSAEAAAAPVAVRAAAEPHNAETPEHRERRAALFRVAAEPPAADFDYRIYSRAYDEILLPERACEPGELGRLTAMLRHQTQPLEAGLVRLANRLERLLRAQQRRRWRFDRDDGVLDAARLSRVIVDPSMPLVYKDEEDLDCNDTVVTLLLDNSGSMRGRPILMTALCADLICRTLERCAIKVEILGYTTREWNGGRSRDAWLRAGCPQRPGRLSDLRHVIYKAADSPWRRARHNLGLMLRDELLKENIDGEALLWAHGRLLLRRERRRILLVISDGVPLDESTLSENSHDFLERHLRSVIRSIECHSPVELVAIGVGHDVTHFYTRATVIRTVDELGAALIGRLAELFSAEAAPERGVRRNPPASGSSGGAGLPGWGIRRPPARGKTSAEHPADAARISRPGRTTPRAG